MSVVGSNYTKRSAGSLPVVTREMVIQNRLGLHARPAALFVKTATRYGSEIRVEKDGEEVNGKSIMGLMLLAAGYGSRIKVTAVGPDAREAIEALEKLVTSKFQDE
ncbi:HPr family phosphocarrier protein [Candidatus Methylacidithermus pantelleriae]|uniref:Phosphocarrier protein HPr n=1 Tax=Candidatus Methylacidithermus pantelleriae TaxID=2744239 RepID=A0A8J2FSV7_9BACT|nr:HPr family phosphocarrier protein [Candidatus Methylacidithermus pantelleriae]CAF0698951.1 Phosphocarrier protein HPr [Candidatus Methylacidithermus pantelleriae]